jgi:hypothetical protein
VEKQEFESMFNQVKVRQKHDYTTEIELKSLIIRLNNWNKIKILTPGVHKLIFADSQRNKKINKYLLLHTKITNTQDIFEKEYKQKLISLKKKLKERIVKLSVQTPIDKDSYETFGGILILMIKNILKKPNFSGYSYKDEFYSDAIHKVLKYLHNFNHLLISERTGVEVNAFAYISQVIHNSVIYIIKQKAKEQENIKDVISLEILYGEIDIRSIHKKSDAVKHSQIEELEQFRIKVESLDCISLVEVIKQVHKEVQEDENLKKTHFTIEYPKSHVISFEEYNDIRPLLKGNINIVRSNK